MSLILSDLLPGRLGNWVSMEPNKQVPISALRYRNTEAVQLMAVLLRGKRSTRHIEELEAGTQ